MATHLIDHRPDRPPRAVRSIVLLVTFGLAAISTLTSCREGNDSRSPSRNIARTPAGASTTLDSIQEAVIRLDAIGLARNDPHVEPNKREWESEVFSDAADKQLKALGQLLDGSSPLDAAHVSKIVDSDYEGGPLRPKALTTAFEDSSLLVRKALPARGPAAADGLTYRARSGFVEALKELLSTMGDAREVRSKFKLFRIQLAENEASSDVYFELNGRADRGMIQQRAVWKCEWHRPSGEPPLLASITVSSFEEATGKSSGDGLFSDCTSAVLGINSSYRKQFLHSTDHWLDRVEVRYGIDPSAWQGIALGDVNGDELEDIYICQPGGLPNRLFVQDADGTARDVSSSAGIDWLDHTHAALFVDLDNDADQDLVLSQKAGVLFASNDGLGKFSVETIKLIPQASPYALSAADFDSDGDLDVYACCYSMRGNADKRDFLQRPVPYHDANNGGRNVMFRNDGQWRFRDATKSVGLSQNNRRYSFAASWDDFDNDGDLDLYVANDYGRNNLFENNEGHFIDVAAQAGVEDIAAGMSVSWGDYNNDGWMDIYVSNMFSSAGNRIAYQRRFHEHSQDAVRAELQRHARGNTLFQNQGDGTFLDVSERAGVTMGRWAWGSVFADLNNDGFEDLVVANGFVTQEDTGDL